MPSIDGIKVSLNWTVAFVLRSITATTLKVICLSLGVTMALLELSNGMPIRPSHPEIAPEKEQEQEEQVSLARKFATQSFDPQSRSPLFSTLPPEIRNRIFAFACTTYDTVPYSPNDWYYRPGYHAHHRISTSLLETCKRAYLETYLLPILQNEHVFWGSAERGPPARFFGEQSYRRTEMREFFDQMPALHLSKIRQLHLFTQQYYLEDWDLTVPPWRKPVATEKLKITIRHQDWWFWEENEPLGICPWILDRVTADDMEREIDTVPILPADLDRYDGWGRQFEHIKGLQELELEFETLRDNKDQMDRIVTFAKQWQFPLENEGVLTWHQASGVKTSKWTGSKLLRGENDDNDLALYGERPDGGFGFDDVDMDYQPDIGDDGDDVGYDSDPTYEYSDWEAEMEEVGELAEGGVVYEIQNNRLDDPEWNALQAEQMNNPRSQEQVSNHGGHVNSPSAFSDMEQAVCNRNESLQEVATSAEADAVTESIAYEPPNMIDGDTDAMETQPTNVTLEETLDDLSQPQLPVAVETVVPLLALESNEQEYYVVSMTWRKMQ